MYSIAATKLSDVLKEKSIGEQVNVHVVEAVNEPQPDFSAMKRLIDSGSVVGASDDQRSEREKREISKGD